MSDEEHHLESKAGNNRKNGFIVIHSRPCKVVEAGFDFVDWQAWSCQGSVCWDSYFQCKETKLEGIVPSSHNCDVPTDYQLIDISEDGFVSLLTHNGNTILPMIVHSLSFGKGHCNVSYGGNGEELICALRTLHRIINSAFTSDTQLSD